MEVLKPKFNAEGLTPIIIQDKQTLEVLMLAWTNEAGWRETLRTGVATFYSRSRKKRWVKGEESGNFMEVHEIRPDCDGDTTIWLVIPQGDKLACHTFARSCFYRNAVGGENIMDAPSAGTEENLEIVDAIVHPRLIPLP